MKNLYLPFVCLFVGAVLVFNPLHAQIYDTLALKKSEVYNFNVGDEFHYSRYYWSSPNYYKTIVTITDIDYSTGNDTLFYTYDLISFLQSNCYIPVTNSHTAIITNLDDYVIHVGDTTALITEYYINGNDTLGYSTIDFEREVEFEVSPTQYNGRRVNRINEDYYYGIDAGYGSGMVYIEGCGSYESISWGDFSGWNEMLIYYRKGTETWGTPIPYEEPIPITPLNSLTIGEAFDFEVGDEFHIKIGFNSVYVKRKVIVKGYNPALEQLYFVYQDSVFQIQGGNVNAYSVQNTQLVTNLNTLCFDYPSNIDTLPSYLNYSCHKVYTAPCDLPGNFLEFTLPNFAKTSIEFIAGCGMYAKYPNIYQNLLYYKKMNGQECGEPIIYTSANETAIKPDKLNVIYDPVNNLLHLPPDYFIASGAEFTLFSAMGQLVHQDFLLPKTNFVQLHNTPAGIYFYRFTTPAGLAVSGKLMISD